MSAINQKEYLKKYLGLGKNQGDKKKKKKKDKIVSKRVQIIDDDIDLANDIQQDIDAGNEDAPQIVAVIDERPPSMRVDEQHNKLWKPIGETAIEAAPTITGINIKLTQSGKSRPNERKKHRSNEDVSPPRRKRVDDSPPASEQVSHVVDSDSSPPRKQIDADSSPPRKSKHRTRWNSSPPRKFEGIDTSPPRKWEKHDLSPPRRSKHKEEKDTSPPRRRENDKDISPPRKRNKVNDISPPRRRNVSRDISPSRKANLDDSSQKKKPVQEMMSKTLDGKKAGLQNAQELAKETLSLKQREDEMFKNMSAEVSGRNAKTVVRAKKQVDPEEEARKNLKEKANKEKYSRWGKGLKQVDDLNDKIAEEQYEMSKPLARYADDEDLERYLKEQEREGDPMLAYLRKKKKKEVVESGAPVKPEYMGEFMPNRFGIKPGYRWDGVDRSNGYEKKWFTVQNSKQASLEESYKWSTEDM